MQDKIGTGAGVRFELPPRGRFQIERDTLVRLLDNNGGNLLRQRIAAGKIRPYVVPVYLAGLAGGGAPYAELLLVDLCDALPLLLSFHGLDVLRRWIEVWSTRGDGRLLIADEGESQADPWRCWPLDDTEAAG